MINCLIFSKNRACQLDLLLESIYRFLKTDLDIHVLAKATNDEYEEGYRIIRDEHMLVQFHWEEDGNFKDQVMAIVDSFDGPWTICFLDDDVFVDYVDLVPYLGYITPDVNALSLRMGMHINYCYPKDVVMSNPGFTLMSNDLMKWNWTQCERSLDWGYPMSLGGNVYRTSWLQMVWNGLPFTSPNLIEGLMAATQAPIIRPNQISFVRQKVYNVANNLVQTVCKNRFEKTMENEPEMLNSAYLDDYKIDLETISKKTYRSANGPAEYKLVLRGD